MAPRRGSLRVYLGPAPGVGKTFAMLNEGRRAKERGADVVVGFVEPHGRVRTAEQIGELEVIPRKKVTYRGATFEEMDVDAVLARKPERALIDELAHTNVPGLRHEKRWEDVEEVLAAGIDVISTLNIQHLESVNDVVERITGVPQRETIPDEVVRSADQVQLIDSTPEEIRRRMAHGNIYAPEKVDTALANYFRPGNLGALRELALLWVADEVDEGLETYRERHGITVPWETRERVLVAIRGLPSDEVVIRRVARIAQRAHADYLGLHVRAEEGLSRKGSGLLEQARQLLTGLGGEYHEAVGGDVPRTLVDFARTENCTQLVLGASTRSRWAELWRGSVINRAIRLSGTIDVHVISHDAAAGSELPALSRHGRHAALPLRRQVAGWLVAAGGLPLVTIVLANLRRHVNLPSALLLYLLLIVATAVVGGAWPALAAAVAGFLLANWYFTPPFYRWTIAEAQNVLALVVFLLVAGVVSAVVDRAARRASEAARAGAEAEALAGLAGMAVRDDPLEVLVRHLRDTFGFEAVALLRRSPDGWHVEASWGVPVPDSPDGADVVEELADDTVLAIAGGVLSGGDRRVLNAFCAQLAGVLERNRLHAAASTAEALKQAGQLRTALLQAVSHDLRTPLASVKAAISSLRSRDVDWSQQESEDFLVTIDEETDRLTTLVGNLLDMSRLQAGVIQPQLRPVALEEVVPAAVASLGERGRGVDVDVPETLCQVKADAALLERVVANLLDNALAWSPPGAGVRVSAGAVAGRVDLRVVDRGPGIPAGERERAFQPFQRLGDSGPRTGVGLGLAVASGFVQAMGGELTVEDTPGGGATVVLSLPGAS